MDKGAIHLGLLFLGNLYSDIVFSNTYMKNKILFLAFFLLFSFLYAQEGEKITKIEVTGNKTTQKGLIINTLSLTENGTYATTKMQESIRNLYKLGLFSQVKSEYFPSKTGGIILRFTVKEFPVLDHYEISGYKKVEKEDIEKKIVLNPGQALSEVDILETKNQIKSLYTEKGFLLANIETNIIHAKDSNKVVLEFDIHEGKKVKVTQITFEGNKNIESSKLAGEMETKEDRWWRSGEFSDEKYQQDLEKITDYYKEKGYLDARIESETISPDPIAKKRIWGRDSSGNVTRIWEIDTLTEEAAKNNLHVHINVEEGNKFLAGRFSFEGNVLFKNPDLEKEIQLEEGDVFDNKKFEYTKWKLQSLYYEEGYIYSRFDENRQFRGDTVDVHFRITEGLPAYVNKVIIEGNIKTQERVIRREIAMFPGNIYRQSKMERSKRNIMHLNFFTDVKYDIKPLENGNVNLLFKVVEREDIGQVSVGVAYSQRDGVVGTASLSIPNFRGAGQKLDLNVERGGVKQDYRIGFSEPWLFNTPTSVGFQLFYSDQTAFSGEYLERGGAVSVGRSLKWPDDYCSVLGSYQFSREDIIQETSTTTVTDASKVVLTSGLRSSLALRFLRDDTDMPDFPSEGSVFMYRPEIFGGFLGGDFDFMKHNFSIQWYYPAFWKFVFGIKAQAGYIDGSKLSAYHLFRAGGVTYDGTIRGYTDGILGGGVSDGLSMITYSASLQFPIMEQQLYFSLFADAGNTYGELRTIDPTDFKRSLGIGVRLAIPMLGIMGFDFAYGFDKVEPYFNDASGFHTHFQVGKGF